MLYGSKRTKFLIRLLIGVAVAVLGLVLHQLVEFTVGLIVLAVAFARWFGHDGSNGSNGASW
jgi:hypothetical protein